MAKVLLGSKKYTNLLETRAIGNSTAPNSVKYAARSMSDFIEPKAVSDAVLLYYACNAIHEGF
jgi:hypothetical protein